MSSKRSLNQSRGSVPLPAAAIGSLAMVLAAGLAGFGLLARIDGLIASATGVGADVSSSLPGWLVWLSAVVVSYGLSFAMLGTPGAGRRLLLWVTALVLTAAWAPVLALAAYQPAIAPWLVAAGWSGICSLAYARNHLMPGEEGPRGARAASPVA
jgi:hypothetical protein